MAPKTRVISSFLSIRILRQLYLKASVSLSMVLPPPPRLIQDFGKSTRRQGSDVGRTVGGERNGAHSQQDDLCDVCPSKEGYPARDLCSVVLVAILRQLDRREEHRTSAGQQNDPVKIRTQGKPWCSPCSMPNGRASQKNHRIDTT